MDRPSVTSGNDTYPLDVAAAWTSDRKSITVAVVNPTESPQNIRPTFDHVALQDQTRKWELAVPDLQTRNVAGQDPPVKIVETPLGAVPDRLEVAPLSVSLYEFNIR